jgi:cytochrome c oxidase cbb3-type subunit III
MLLRSRYLWWVSVLGTLWLVSSVGTGQTINPDQKSNSAAAGGRQIFASNCAACHGLDGKGSERAPNIVDGADVRGMSRVQVFRIIQNGIPGTGMPAFHTLSSTQIDALVTHLRSLGGAKTATQQLPGDPDAGKNLFAGKAECSHCHMVGGAGGFIASDLSEYGRIHPPEEIRSAMVGAPDSRGNSVRMATITLRTGDKYIGRVRNEDNFSIQLQTLDGAFHLISRSDLEKFEYDPKPMMPSDYKSTLTSKEIDDLVSYLMSAAGGAEKKHSTKHGEEDCSPDCDY